MTLVRYRRFSESPDVVWPTSVQTCAGTAQQMPQWLDVLDQLGEEACQIVAHEQGLVTGWLTYVVSRSKVGTLVNSLPYLPYGGPVSTDPLVEKQLLDALLADASALGADVVSMALHPLLNEQDVARWCEALSVTHRFSNFVQIQTLKHHPLKTMKSRARSGIQRKLRRSQENGISVCLAESASDVEAWLAVYRQRFEEIGGKAYPDDFFRLAFCQPDLKQQVIQLWLAKDRHDQIIGGTWIFLGTRCADYFASAFDSVFNDQYPATLVMNQIFQSLIDRGVPLLNWQSSPGRGGVYEFKRRWGAEERSHQYCSVVLKPDSPILFSCPEELGACFPLRFVLPFSALQDSRS